MSTYFTLLVREAGIWAPQFGSPTRQDCADERQLEYIDKGYRRGDCLIVQTAPTQEAINAVCAELNSRQQAAKGGNQ